MERSLSRTFYWWMSIDMKSVLHGVQRARASKALESKKFGLRKGEVVILMYHGVVDTEPVLPDWCLVHKRDFEDQVKFLKNNFNLVSLQEAIDGLNQGGVEGPTAVITFDDGYRNNHDVAFPILSAYQVPATIFLTTRFIDSSETIWTGGLQEIFGKTTIEALKWRDHCFDLSSTASKKQSLEFVKKQLKQESFSVIQRECIDIANSLMIGTGLQVDESSPYRMMTSAMVESMSESGLIDFGAHTHNHPILSRLSKQEQKEEIESSIAIVSRITGKPCRVFAYPNGSRDDYTSDTVDLMNESGISLALSTELGLCKKETPVMELRRFGVGNEADFKRELYSMYTRRWP